MDLVFGVDEIALTPCMRGSTEYFRQLTAEKLAYPVHAGIDRAVLTM